MANNSESRTKAARDATKMTSAELNEYAVGRTAGDSFRQSIVEREFERRAADSARRAETAAIVSAVVAVISIFISVAAWLFH